VFLVLWAPLLREHLSRALWSHWQAYRCQDVMTGWTPGCHVASSHSSAEPLINDDLDVPSRADGNRAVDARLSVLWLEQTTYSSDRGCFLHRLGSQQ
jgi:hypothetical protein